jgi:hypothetical protein
MMIIVPQLHGPITPPRGITTEVTRSEIIFTLPDGVVIRYPRNPVAIGDLRYSYAKAENGTYRYEYVFDNRLVQSFNIADGAAHDADEIWESPPGWWRSMGIDLPGTTPARSENAKYTVLSSHLPGLTVMYFVALDPPSGPELPPISNYKDWRTNLRLQEDYQQATLTVDIYGHNLHRLAIGPAIAPNPSQDDITALVKRWAGDYGLRFLQPLVESGADLEAVLDSLTPANDLEKDIVFCLRLALA